MAEKKDKMAAVWNVFVVIGKVIYFLRGVLFSIPVIVVAIKLAMRNAELLPEMVGINLLENGEYQWMIAREAAVRGPVMLTLLCLVMVICSRRFVYPWLISVFSLAIPLVIWITNVFPA